MDFPMTFKTYRDFLGESKQERFVAKTELSLEGSTQMTEKYDNLQKLFEQMAESLDK